MNSSQSETFCDGWYLRNKLDLQSFGDAFSLRSSWSEKYCWFVYCIPVPILIKLQISLYILLEISSYTVICLRSWLRTPLCLEHDSLGVKISFFTPWPWRLRNPIPTTAGRAGSEQKSVPFLTLLLLRNLSRLSEQWGMELKHATLSGIRYSFPLCLTTWGSSARAP